MSVNGFRSATDNGRNRIKKRDLPGVVVIDTPVCF